MDEPPAFCPSCGELLPILGELRETVFLLERELRGKRAQIARLQGEADRDPVFDPHKTDADEVFAYWKANVMPRAREFTDERLAKVLARLRAGHSVADLKRAVDGAAARPFVIRGRRSAQGPPDAWFADLELICRSEPKLRSFAAIADAEAIEPAPEPPELGQLELEPANGANGRDLYRDRDSVIEAVRRVLH